MADEHVANRLALAKARLELLERQEEREPGSITPAQFTAARDRIADLMRDLTDDTPHQRRLDTDGYRD